VTSPTRRAAAWSAVAWRASVLLAAVTLATACDQGLHQRPRQIVSVGQPAPDYATTRMDGTPISLADHRGDVVLLNIWATWCKPCREEIPALEQLHQEFAAQGLVVAGVSIDVISDTARIAGFARDLGATYPLWHDPDDRVSGTFLSIGVPTTYLIDRDGVLRWRHMGVVRADDRSLREALGTALSPTDTSVANAAPDGTPAP